MIKSRILTLARLLMPIGVVLSLLSCSDTTESTIVQDTGTSDNSMIYGGLERTYRIFISRQYDGSRPVPLVIVLHGGGGTGKEIERLTLGGFNKLADRDGFIVVYPDAVDNNWNDGRGVQLYRSQRENIDDVGFIAALIDHLSNELTIDEKRVYVTGASNGALMSYRLACELSEKITAIAPVIGAIPVEIMSRCSSASPISVLIINGTEDPMIPWEGGYVQFNNVELGKVLSTPNTVSHWVQLDNCASTPAITWLDDLVPEDSTRVRREVYSNGKEGTEVILYAIEGGGHTWPNGLQYLPEDIIGRVCRDIDATEIIWNFFKTRSMP